MKLPGSQSWLNASMPSGRQTRLPSRIIVLGTESVNQPALDRSQHTALNPSEGEGEREQRGRPEELGLELSHIETEGMEDQSADQGMLITMPAATIYQPKKIVARIEAASALICSIRYPAESLPIAGGALRRRSGRRTGGRPIGLGTSQSAEPVVAMDRGPSPPARPAISVGWPSATQSAPVNARQ